MSAEFGDLLGFGGHAHFELLYLVLQVTGYLAMSGSVHLPGKLMVLPGDNSTQSLQLSQNCNSNSMAGERDMTQEGREQGGQKVSDS